MKRSVQQLNASLSEQNHEYAEQNSILKQLYLENSKKQQVQQEQQVKQSDVVKQQMEEDELAFSVGTFCINCLTHYPKEERPRHIMPFINILYENSHIDVKLEQPKKTLQSALMTCYGFENQLLEPIVKSNVELIIVNDNDSVSKKAEVIKNYNNYHNWTLIKPAKLNTSQYSGAFHPKIWLLKFPQFLRVVIGSQNLHVGDWTVWSQAMWIQDFKKGESKLDEISSEFKTTLKEFMREILPSDQNFEELLQIKYDEYDFSNVNIRLITSIPGRYMGNQLYKYGLMRLQNVVYQEIQKHKLTQMKKSAITYQTTSLGSLDSTFISLLKQSTAGYIYKQIPQDNKQLIAQQQEQAVLKIVYPTRDYIESKTIAGVDFANPLFMKKQLYENINFPKQSLHQFEGSHSSYYWHTGLIPHLKVMIISGIDMEINDDTIIYIGSHNLSQAAWGKLEKNGQQLYIANTELGVLYPPGKQTAKQKQQIIDQLPFKYPPDQYAPNDRPWISEVYYQEQAQHKQQQH